MTVPLHQLLDHPTLTIVLHKRLEYISGHIDFLRLNDVRITHYIPITFDKDDKSLNHQIALAKMLGPHVESRRSGFPAAIFQWQGKGRYIWVGGFRPSFHPRSQSRAFLG
jgi:hypothetical protein